MIGLEHQYNLANWYVYFYIYALCVLPLLSWLFRSHELQKLAALVIICGVITYLNNRSNIWMQAIAECTSYTQILAVGYVCAKTQILSKCSSYISSKYIWASLAVGSVVLQCVTGAVLGILTGVVWVPVFIISISALFTNCENSRISKALTSLGAASTMMWFIHAIPLSDATRSMFQTSPYWINNAAVQFVILTLGSYIIAIAYNKTLKRII